MSYTLDRFLPDVSMAEAEARVRAALAAQGFGIVTEIDLCATLAAKLGESIPPYRILGACAPKYAFALFSIEPKVGAMLPCNVILRALEGGVEVSAVDPLASLQGIGNPALAAPLAEVRGLVETALAAL